MNLPVKLISTPPSVKPAGKVLHPAHYLLHIAQVLFTLTVAVFIESSISTVLLMKKSASSLVPITVQWNDGSTTTNYIPNRIFTNLSGQFQVETGLGDDGSVVWRVKKKP